jgi:hypothetical protein
MSAAGACGTASARCTSTLFSDEAEEMPKPETWSFLAEDAEELPASCHLREKPGGCDAEDSMAMLSKKGERERGAGDQGVAGEGLPTAAEQRTPAYLPLRSPLLFTNELF